MARTKKTTRVLPTDVKQNIIDASYSDIMSKSYVDYALSVIISRAVPDIRDGLKPVQRRVIYDMYELGTSSDKPYRKSARIVGDTMGKYHPHGDSSIYESLVVMSQDFKKSQPFVDGHGNFGSIEGDGAAAMRYTEARLQKFAEDVMLKDLKNGTVEFIDNYDATEKEPALLPCRLPNFLINGSEGIAVGMTTSTPTHNTGEVIDAVIAYIKKNSIKTEDLLSAMHGPDFPTGGIIANASELKEIYETGKGKLRIRGRAVLEKSSSGKFSIVITEIPYTMIGVNISKFILDIASLVENHVITEVSDIINQSGKDGIRIVLELKKGCEKDFDKIINILCKKTKFEDTFGVNMLAVIDNKPEVMSLKRIFECFYNYQEELLINRSKYLLDKDKKKNEINQGLVKAVDIIDTIIEILRGSNNIKQAKDCLINGNTKGIVFKTKKASAQAAKLCFTELQAQAILDMKLSKLIKLELNALFDEIAATEKRIKYYTSILEDKTGAVKKKEIIKGLNELKDLYSSPRKTEITNISPAEVEEKEIPDVPIVVLIDRFYYIHSIDMSVYEKNKDQILADYKYVIPSSTKSKIAIFTDTGKMHTIKNQDVPSGKLKDKGQPIDNISGYVSSKENIVNVFSLDALDSRSFVFVSSDGYAKRVPAAEFDVSRKTTDATKLYKDAKVAGIFEYNEKGHIILANSDGFIIRYRQAELPNQKKLAAGACAMKMKDEESRITHVIGVSGPSVAFSIEDKAYTAKDIALTKRGGKGTKIKS